MDELKKQITLLQKELSAKPKVITIAPALQPQKSYRKEYVAVDMSRRTLFNNARNKINNLGKIVEI